jgi:hypothetical protein
MEPRERFEEIVDDLLARDPDVSETQMMGMPAVKRHGKLWIGFWRDGMVFKLVDSEARERALALQGAHLFDPSEKGQPMREWVVVPVAHAGRWAELAEQAISITSSA